MDEETLTKDLDEAFLELERRRSVIARLESELWQAREALEVERERRQAAEHVLRFVAALPAYSTFRAWRVGPVMTARTYLAEKEHSA